MEQLQGSGIKLSIQTKSDLVLRDLDLLKSLPNARVGFSINTLDETFKDDMDKLGPVPTDTQMTAIYLKEYVCFN